LTKHSIPDERKNAVSKLYIAYGSNLNKRQMRIRCPGAKSLGWFFLKDARLVFRGVADIEFKKGEKVPVGLWRISTQNEATLDHYEGVDGGMYYKDERIIINYKGRPTPVLVYLMNSEGVYPPSDHYANAIREGYKNFGLPEKYLDNAIEQSFNKEPDEQTTARRARQKKDPVHAKLVKVPEAVVKWRLEKKAALEKSRWAEFDARMLAFYKERLAAGSASALEETSEEFGEDASWCEGCESVPAN
jgi:hypothetical protein